MAEEVETRSMKKTVMKLQSSSKEEEEEEDEKPDTEKGDDPNTPLLHDGFGYKSNIFLEYGVGIVAYFQLQTELMKLFFILAILAAV